MSFLAAAWNVFRKDLTQEIRSGEIVLSTALFAALAVVLCAFAFGLDAAPGSETAAGVLWISIAFAGILALSRTFLREREMGVWTAVLLTPAPRAALYAGKALGVAVFLLVVEAVLVPIVALLFEAPLLERAGLVAPVLVLGDVGYAAAGTLFAAMTIRTRLRDLVLGVVLFPLISPVLIASVEATAAVLAGEGLSAAAGYLEILAVFDVVFLVGGLWLFDPLMED